MSFTFSCVDYAAIWSGPPVFIAMVIWLIILLTISVKWVYCLNRKGKSVIGKGIGLIFLYLLTPYIQSLIANIIVDIFFEAKNESIGLHLSWGGTIDIIITVTVVPITVAIISFFVWLRLKRS